MPETFGKYLLLDRINQGGMAEVYLAKAFGYGGTDQVIALKRIRREVSEDPSFVEMFVNEAKLAVQLNHANIAQVIELGKAGANYYIAMEYVAGRDLRAVINRANHEGWQIPEHLAAHVLALVLEGLDFAHRKKDPSGRALDIVHRDVSPHNVIISYTGEVKLIDFGIAKVATNTTTSQSGVLKGKYGYMAPEQVLGQPVDARTDVFAAGVLFYELLTQKRLFEGASDFSILEKVRYAEVYPPSMLAPRVPPELEAVVLRALAADPARRYASASDMHDAVVEVMLRAFGQPTPRELANLMKSLFAVELKNDLRLLENARSLSPAGTPNVREETTVVDRAPLPGDLDERPGTEPRLVLSETTAPGTSEKTDPHVGPLEPPAGPDTDKLSAGSLGKARQRRRATDPADGEIAATRIVARPQRRRVREQWIIALALVVSIALVLVTWMITRHGTRATGQVMILSVPPGATVILDNDVVGRTPYQAEAVPVGKHTMTLRRAGYVTESRVIDVVPGKILPVQLILTEETARGP